MLRLSGCNLGAMSNNHVAYTFPSTLFLKVEEPIFKNAFKTTLNKQKENEDFSFPFFL